LVDYSTCPVKWISDKGWEDILKLATDFPEVFGDLPNNIEKNIDIWKAWYDLEAPEEVDTPNGYTQKMNPFQVATV